MPYGDASAAISASAPFNSSPTFPVYAALSSEYSFCFLLMPSDVSFGTSSGSMHRATAQTSITGEITASITIATIPMEPHIAILRIPV